MAIHAHSTPAPGFQRRLLRAARLLALGAVPVPTPALTPETVAMLDALPVASDIESVLTDTLRVIERLTAQARARIAAYDAGKSATVADLAPLPSLTSAFSRRREIFGAFDGEAA